jgi:hypothetical protein
LTKFLPRIRQAHPQITVVEFLSIEHLNRFLGFGWITHLDESEASRATAHPVLAKPN